MTVNKFACGHIEYAEAREVLSKYDLSDREHMKKDIREIIDILFPVEVVEESKPKQKAKKEKKPIVNELTE